MILASSVTSMLPPHDQHHGAPRPQIGLGLNAGGQCGRARALGQRLLLLQQHENGAGDLLVVHGDDLVHVAGDQRQRQVAGAAHGDAVGDGGLGSDSDRRAGLARPQHRRQLLRLHADHANPGVDLLQRAGDAANQPAAADGHHDRLDVRAPVRAVPGRWFPGRRSPQRRRRDG